MDRREAVRDMALYFGFALSASAMASLSQGCKPKKDAEGNIVFTKEEQQLVDEIADTILPPTDTPGAKEAGVGPFVIMMINDCYEVEEQKKFLRGLRKVNKLSANKYKKTFVQLTLEERAALMTQLGTDSKAYNEKRQQELVTTQKDLRGKDAANTNTGEDDYEENYFYPIMHELTILGYFTSEVGATQALAYVAIPGSYQACTDLKPGQKAWML